MAAAFLPDASLYAMVAWNGFVRGMEPAEIFGRAYFDPFWQSVFAVDNSVFVWGLLLAIGLGTGVAGIVAFAGSGLLHILGDFPLHHDDGRAHFWPVSDWIFESPVSYWDPAHHGQIVGALEALLCVALCAVLWRRFQGGWARGLIGLAFVSQVLPTILFGLLL
ncbi:MAG: cobalamin biosynthesis protein CobQ [Pseudomonadota bacterium]